MLLYRTRPPYSHTSLSLLHPVEPSLCSTLLSLSHSHTLSLSSPLPTHATPPPPLLSPVTRLLAPHVFSYDVFRVNDVRAELAVLGNEGNGGGRGGGLPSLGGMGSKPLMGGMGRMGGGMGIGGGMGGFEPPSGPMGLGGMNRGMNRLPARLAPIQSSQNGRMPALPGIGSNPGQGGALAGLPPMGPPMGSNGLRPAPPSLRGGLR